jgi:tRNA-Thr(GGU) m(6)t(6)A37 methyltransferase TsaA
VRAKLGWKLVAFATDALDGLAEGDHIIVVTWLHKALRDVFKVHPRGNENNPLTGVFATRSPDRPNPLGLYRVIVRRIDNNRLLVGPIEAIDRTPVVDISRCCREPETSKVSGAVGFPTCRIPAAGRDSFVDMIGTSFSVVGGNG